jgi:PAS domain S-box-containing protein
MLGNLTGTLKSRATIIELEIYRALLKNSEIKLALREIISIVKKGLKIDRCSILLFDSEKKPLIRAYIGKHKRGSVSFNNDQGLVNIQEAEKELLKAVIAAKKPILIKDIKEEKGFSFHGNKGRMSERAFLSIPLIGKGNVLGILTISNYLPDSINKEARELMGYISKFIPEAIQYLMERDELIKSKLSLKRKVIDRDKALKEIRSNLLQCEEMLKEKDRSIYVLGKQLIDIRQFSESVLQSLSSGLISVDMEGRITYMNREAERILQCDFKEMASRPLQDIFTGKGENLDILSEGKAQDTSPYGMEMTLRTRDGKEIPIGYSISSHLDATGNEIGKIIHFRDLTDKKRMQEEILRMDRLVSLGEISMGIAHEIRNPLAGIRITAQAMEEELPQDDLKREYLNRIIKEIDRLNDLLKSFFSFAKPEKPEFSLCHIKDIVREVYFLIKKDLRDRHIDFIEDYAEGLPKVMVDFNQMKQAFLNLLLNSIQAMPRGGLLRIGCTMINNSLVKGKGGRYLEITVSDTGKGIDEEVLPRIFDPFFTTKAKGLGLGLSITYRIIKRHNGEITVKSKKGEGTIFYIKLPIQFH